MNYIEKLLLLNLIQRCQAGMETPEMLQVAEMTAKSIDNVRRTLDPMNAIHQAPAPNEGTTMYNFGIKPPVAGKRKPKVSASEVDSLKNQLAEKTEELKIATQKVAVLYSLVEEAKEEISASAETFFEEEFLKLQRKIYSAVSGK